ncbi:hypothetical protein OH492_29515 [Vibrio chagasii]|nr:hypothetical protein [Vibrio chagasii]
MKVTITENIRLTLIPEGVQLIIKQDHYRPYFRARYAPEELPKPRSI